MSGHVGFGSRQPEKSLDLGTSSSRNPVSVCYPIGILVAFVFRQRFPSFWFTRASELFPAELAVSRTQGYFHKEVQNGNAEL